MYVNKLYFAFIQPYIDYSLSIWGYTSRNNFSKCQRVQNRAVRVLTKNFNYDFPSLNIIRGLGLQTMSERREFLTSVLMFKCIYGLAPNYLSDSLVYTHEVHSRFTRKRSLSVTLNSLKGNFNTRAQPPGMIYLLILNNQPQFISLKFSSNNG